MVTRTIVEASANQLVLHDGIGPAFASSNRRIFSFSPSGGQIDANFLAKISSNSWRCASQLLSSGSFAASSNAPRVGGPGTPAYVPRTRSDILWLVLCSSSVFLLPAFRKRDYF